MWIILLASKEKNINKKIVNTSINYVFFMLLAEKSPEIFPIHNEYFFISESFALN